MSDYEWPFESPEPRGWSQMGPKEKQRALEVAAEQAADAVRQAAEELGIDLSSGSLRKAWQANAAWRADEPT